MKIVDSMKSTVAQMVATNGYHVRPTAIYGNPVLLDLIDQELKSEYNVVLNTDQITGGFRVKMLSTQAGDLPLIPDWSLAYTGTPGTGNAVLPAYIVSEDLIEYHWLGEVTPRIFQLGLPNSLTYQHVAVKFGAPCGKGRELCALSGGGGTLRRSTVHSDQWSAISADVPQRASTRSAAVHRSR